MYQNEKLRQLFKIWDPLQTLAAILLVATFTMMPPIDAAIDIQGYARFSSIKSAGGRDPSSDSSPGNHVDATKAVCEEANKGHLVCYSGGEVGSCTAYVINTWVNPDVDRVWYLSRCPGSPAFYVKNIGGDKWSVFYP